MIHDDDHPKDENNEDSLIKDSAKDLHELYHKTAVVLTKEHFPRSAVELLAHGSKPASL